MENERMQLQPLSHIHLPRHDIDSRQSTLLQPVTAIDWGDSLSRQHKLFNGSFFFQLVDRLFLRFRTTTQVIRDRRGRRCHETRPPG
ncbi:hypothetical protein RDI58_002056 [Solanum bulbocastanum]|uniref:Uncharacterized protein n=1 Tax=Solanum bulbocastanum TaxID=147425 RepID=A0AAN8YTU1_SOLBU